MHGVLYRRKKSERRAQQHDMQPAMQPWQKSRYPNFCHHPQFHPCCTVLRWYANNCLVGDATIHIFAALEPQTLVYGGGPGCSVHSDTQRRHALQLLRKDRQRVDNDCTESPVLDSGSSAPSRQCCDLDAANCSFRNIPRSRLLSARCTVPSRSFECPARKEPL